MKKIIPILLTILLLAGCRIETDIRPDTIVDIPLAPTEEVTEPTTEEATEAPTEAPTVPATEAPTEAPAEKGTEKATEKPTEKPKSSSKGTSSKKPSSGSSSKKDKTPKATESTKATEAAKPTEPPTEAPTKAPSKPTGSYSATKLDKAIIAAVNEARAEAGLSELASSKKLTNAAAQRAYELSTHWSHTRPNGSDFSTVLKEYGISGSSPAECLYYDAGSFSADDVIELWISTNNTIFSEQPDTFGVASYTEDGVTYICALFIG